MSEEQLEYLRQDIDEQVGVWLTAHGISDEVQMELDYSDYDNELEALLKQARRADEA